VEQTYHLEPHKLGPTDYMSAIWKLSLSRVLLSCLLLSLLVALAAKGALESIDSSYPALTYWLIFILGWPFYVWITHRSTRQRVVSKDNSGLFLTRYIALEEKQVVIAIESGVRSQVPYNTIVRTQEVGSFYILYLSALQFLIFPKFIFTPEADVYFRDRVGLPKLK
jgi:hypothetical protein